MKNPKEEARRYILSYLKSNEEESIGHLQYQLERECNIDLTRSDIRDICKMEIERGILIKHDVNELEERYAINKRK